MKDIIKYFYNIDAQTIIQSNQNYEFKQANIKFLLCPLTRNNEELSDILQICNELKSKNIKVHTLILNRENKLISKILEQNYILLKLEEKENKEINIIDIMDFQDNLLIANDKLALYRNSWGILWSQKVDYFEYQVHELGKNKSVILNSLSYYIGLAENAIEYVNNTTKKFQGMRNEKVSLSHKRIYFPNEAKDFYNPLQFIFDLQVRDIAEYIKSAFFQNEKDAWIEFKTFLSKRVRNEYEYQMFYARMIYPSYYFDVYEKVMNNEEKEEKLLKFIDKVSDYEKFLKRIYLELRKISILEEINWLKK